MVYQHIFSHVPRFSQILPSFPIFSRRPCGRALGLTGHVLGPGAGGPFLGRRRLSAAGGPTGGRERVEPARGGGEIFVHHSWWVQLWPFISYNWLFQWDYTFYKWGFVSTYNW